MKQLIRVFLLVAICQFSATAQQNFDDQDLLSSKFHAGRRQALIGQLPEKSCAIFFSNPVRIRTNDVDYQFVQDPDFYYLTGYTEPNAVLFLFKDKVQWQGLEVNAIIFIQDKDPEDEMWNGRRAGKAFVADSLKLPAVAFNYELDKKQPPFTNVDQLLIKWPTDIGPSSGKKNTLNWMVDYVKRESEGMSVKSSGLLYIMAALRQIKSEEELVLMRKAIAISVEGLADAIRSVKPGMKEYQAQAIAEFRFKEGGAEYPGYSAIAGSGSNGCVLHYVTNRSTLGPDDLLLMDMGAEYHGYTADVTRTIPVNGAFSERQKLIYDIVLAAQDSGIAASLPGHSFHAPHLAASRVIAAGLMHLGIIKGTDELLRYFPHSTSHYLGLEVHDAGHYGLLEPGMVITVEPGIYIPEGSPCDPKWWNIGIRIEDDILITDNQPVNMSVALPRTTAAIEQLMQETSIFNDVTK